MLARRIALACLTALSLTGPAFAQAEVCIDPGTGGINQEATAGLQQMIAQTDPNALRQIVGTWYTEMASPGSNQMSQLYYTFEANNLFSYQNQVCDHSTGHCSQYQGTGVYGARAMPDGTLAIMSSVSNLQRDRFCSVSQGRLLDPSTLQAAGQTWRRVR